MFAPTAQNPASGNAFREALALSRAEFRCLGLIGTMLMAWLVLSQVVNAAYGTAGAGSMENMATFLGLAIRNGLLLGTAGGGFLILRALRESGDEAAVPFLVRRISERRHALAAMGVRVLAGLASFALFMLAYTTIKTLIPAMAPFAWDETFWRLDRALFLGNDPWRLFEGLYAYPWVIRTLDVVYDVWAGILVGGWVLAFVLKRPLAERYRFVVAILLTWFIGGTVLALVFSSAGPCFYAAATGLADPYAPQMAILNAVGGEMPLRAVGYQQALWAIHANPGTGVAGISAMPSMHCATAFLLVLWVWPVRWARIAALVFFAVIFVSAFVLAWHYAVDGVLGAAVAAGAWWLAGRMMRTAW